MEDVKHGWMGRRSAPLRRGLSIAGWLLLASFVIGLPGCERRSKMDEAVEEIEDEARDARDEIKDEVDDHT